MLLVIGQRNGARVMELSMIPVSLQPHQVPVFNDVNSQLAAYNRSLLAAMTGFGKTEVAVKLIQGYVQAGKRVLVLAHGQDVLRRNFSDRLERYKVPHCRLDNGKGAEMAQAWNVVVTLPQTAYRNMAKLGAFDLIVVDEAHQLYNTEKKMYAAISAAHSGQWFLLTASHYGMETPETKSFFSMEEALAIDALQDVTVRVQEIDAKIKDSDYTADNELKQETRVSFKARAVADYLTADRLPALVITHNIQAAKDVEKQLKKVPGLKGKVARSDSKNDRDSDILKDFANPNGRTKVLVVVYRANLGFDMEHLATVIDASYTQNVVRVQQMVGRLTRRSTVNKMFVKLAPTGFEADMRLIVTAVLALGMSDIYRTWDGKYQNVKIRTEPDPEPPMPPGPPSPPSPPRPPEPPKGPDAPQPPEGPLPPGTPVPEPKPPRGPLPPEEPGEDERKPRRLPKLAATFGEYQFFVESGKGSETTLHRALAACRADRGGRSLPDPEGKKYEILEIIRATGKTLPKKHPLRGSFTGYTAPLSAGFDEQFTKEVNRLVQRQSKRKLSVAEKIEKTLAWYHGGCIGRMPNYASLGCASFCQEARDALIAAGYDPKINKQKNAQKTSKPISDSKGRVYSSASAAARQLGLNGASVSEVCRGKRKSIGGLTFWYVDSEGNKID
jgi:superfamily II DNA or RNA helicase